MKKTYSNPQIEVIKIVTQQMLALSSVETSSTRQDPGSAAGREFDFDDEDEY